VSLSLCLSLCPTMSLSLCLSLCPTHPLSHLIRRRPGCRRLLLEPLQHLGVLRLHVHRASLRLRRRRRRHDRHLLRRRLHRARVSRPRLATARERVDQVDSHGRWKGPCLQTNAQCDPVVHNNVTDEGGRAVSKQLAPRSRLLRHGDERGGASCALQLRHGDERGGASCALQLRHGDERGGASCALQLRHGDERGGASCALQLRVLTSAPPRPLSAAASCASA
jgi:hypothetical protein